MRPVHFREMEEVMIELEDFARAKGISLSAVIRWACREFCSKHTKELLRPGETLDN
jgi:hypothetical protein